MEHFIDKKCGEKVGMAFLEPKDPKGVRMNFKEVKTMCDRSIVAFKAFGVLFGPGHAWSCRVLAGKSTAS